MDRNIYGGTVVDLSGLQWSQVEFAISSFDLTQLGQLRLKTADNSIL